MKLSILSYSLIPKEHGKSDLKNNSLIKRGILATGQELFFFFNFIQKVLIYSQLSLFGLHSSRITACLEEKSWSLLKHDNLTTDNKILWKKGEIAP